MPTPDVLIVTPGFPLVGSYTLPGDKSISHRCALLAAMAEGESEIGNFLDAGVTRCMLEALTQLGVFYKLEDRILRISSLGISGWITPKGTINCGNSATTMRLLAGALAASGLPAVLDGTPGLQKRPMDRITQPLQLMGVPIQATASNYAPLVLHSRRKDCALKALEYVLPVASAQVKSCLLLAALAARGKTILREPGPSRDHTERLLAFMGVGVECSNRDGSFIVSLTPPPQIELKPFHYQVPGDFSSAAFLIVAALVTPGSVLSLENVGINPTRIGLLDALIDMGAQIEIHVRESRGGEPTGDLIVHHSVLHSTVISGSQVVRMIDEFPALAVAAAFADGMTVVKDAAELRLKESDRIGRLTSEFSRLGIPCNETSDGFVIQGGTPLMAGSVNSHGDHRLAMALTLAGLAGKSPVTISGAQVIDESFPEFTGALRALGAIIMEASQS